ncbi:MAG: flagellin [Bacillota bacterium]
MRINHNVAALNTYRQLTVANNAATKAMEKLSSGLGINKAGDNAAGLAISEKMRGQIRGLDQASRNAQDGISLIQTAEGALNETHAILQRMRELAVQSANDTYTEVDRSEIQKEIDQLSQELSRIGSTTEFNTQKLLNGNFKGTFHIGANENQSLSLEVGDMRGFALGMAGDAKLEVTADVTDASDGNVDLVDGVYQVKANSSGTYDLVNADGVVIATSDADAKIFTAATGDDTITFDEAVTSGTVEIDEGTATAVGTVSNSGLEAGSYTYVEAENALKDANGNVVAKSTDGATFTTLDGSKELVKFSQALTDGDKFEVGGIDVSSQTSANGAITRIQTAIETVSAERSKLGAYQNRLEHTINNLGASSENLTAAESRIRDVDMAKEMMEFTRANILSQAAQAMLAQANQLPQGVLQLLR